MTLESTCVAFNTHAYRRGQSPARIWMGNCLTTLEYRVTFDMTTSRRSRGGPAVVRVDGPLRAPTNGNVRRQVQALLGQGQLRIVLSLAGVTDLDAAGIEELVQVYNATLAAGGALRIADARARVRELLRRVALLDLLEDESTFADEDERSAGRASTVRT